MFNWHGRMNDIPPHIMEPKVFPKSDCMCAFCIFVFGLLDDLTEKDKATYREHLRQRHGLTGDPSP